MLDLVGMSAHNRIHPWLLVLGLAACGSGAQSFQPTENVEGTTIEGLSAASYDLAGAVGPVGSVKVWSRGARDEGGQTLLHVGFTIENGGDDAIVFQRDATTLDAVYAAEGNFGGVYPSYAGGDVVVPPRSTQDVEMTFAMPPGFAATDVSAFRVRWSTATGGHSYTEFTPFVARHDDAYVPVYAYYDPYGYPYYDPFWHRHRRVIVIREPARRVIVHGDRPRTRDHRSTRPRRN
jgi:hypothetical protein